MVEKIVSIIIGINLTLGLNERKINIFNFRES